MVWSNEKSWLVSSCVLFCLLSYKIHSGTIPIPASLRCFSCSFLSNFLCFLQSFWTWLAIFHEFSKFGASTRRKAFSKVKETLAVSLISSFSFCVSLIVRACQWMWTTKNASRSGFDNNGTFFFRFFFFRFSEESATFGNKQISERNSNWQPDTVPRIRNFTPSLMSQYQKSGKFFHGKETK